MKGSLKKVKWSKEEDNLIKNYIEKYGIGRSWQGLSNTLGLQRCGRSCRKRWLNYLRPGLKHGNFTPAEDRIIYEMYSEKGSCWSAIAAKLPGRTDLAIMNYWNSTLKKRFPRAARSCRLRHRRTSNTSSDDAESSDLALVVYNEEESISPTEGSSPVQAREQPPLAMATANEEPIAAVPISGPARLEPWTGEEMDVDCGPMSPVPLGLMEPDLPHIAMEPGLPCITMGLPDIAAASFLSFD